MAAIADERVEPVRPAAWCGDGVADHGADYTDAAPSSTATRWSGPPVVARASRRSSM